MGFAVVIDFKVSYTWWLDEPTGASSMPALSVPGADASLSDHWRRCLGMYLRVRERATVSDALRPFVDPGFKRHVARIVVRGAPRHGHWLAFVRGSLSISVEGCVTYKLERSCGLPTPYWMQALGGSKVRVADH